MKFYKYGKDQEYSPCIELDDGTILTVPEYVIRGREALIQALNSYGAHSYTPAQVDAFIDGVSTVAELRALLKTMAKCIIALATYFESTG